jgi:hypothetical protein
MVPQANQRGSTSLAANTTQAQFYPANIIGLTMPMHPPTGSMLNTPTTYGFNAPPITNYPDMNCQGTNLLTPYSRAGSTFANTASTSGLLSVLHNPNIEAEAPSPLSLASMDDRSLMPSPKPSSPEPHAASVVGRTGVDCLMRAIQTQQPAPLLHAVAPTKKIHLCHFEGCTKIFNRKDHLITHTHQHAGYKPYVQDLDHWYYHS